MNECTCFKAHIYGRCEYCLEWLGSTMFKKVKELIQKYPNEVRELLDNGTRTKSTHRTGKETAL
jgi:hypothetical protein